MHAVQKYDFFKKLFVLLWVCGVHTCPIDARITVTEQKVARQKVCEQGITKQCHSNLCTFYCKDRYRTASYHADDRLEDCVARCDDMCHVKLAPESVDTVLDKQLRTQLVMCMNDKNKDAWSAFLTPEFQTLKNRVMMQERIAATATQKRTALEKAKKDAAFSPPSHASIDALVAQLDTPDTSQTVESMVDHIVQGQQIQTDARDQEHTKTFAQAPIQACPPVSTYDDQTLIKDGVYVGPVPDLEESHDAPAPSQTLEVVYGANKIPKPSLDPKVPVPLVDAIKGSEIRKGCGMRTTFFTQEHKNSNE